MFLFDSLTGEYQHAVGQSHSKTARPKTARVSPLKVRGALDDYLDAKTREAQSLAEQLRNREITIAQWQAQTRDLIAESHLNAAMLAKGGKERMRYADYGRVGSLVKFEYRQLEKLAVQIENGLPPDGRFMQRIAQYAEAPRHSYHVVETREMKARSMGEQRFIRHAGDSCDDCVRLAALGWHETGSTPEPGERQCHRKCKCTKEYRKSKKVKTGSIEADRSRIPFEMNAGDARYDEITDGLDAIGDMVNFADAPQNTIQAANIADHGLYRHDDDLIQIGFGTPRPRLATAHEHGHVADWHIFSDGFAKASNAADDPDSDLFEWWQAVTRSKAHADWEDALNDVYLRGDAEYWLQPNEMLARSFAQLIASRTPDENRRQKMLEELGLAREQPLRDGYWDDDDFEPIAEALLSALEKRGVLVK